MLMWYKVFGLQPAKTIWRISRFTVATVCFCLFYLIAGSYLDSYEVLQQRAEKAEAGFKELAALIQFGSPGTTKTDVAEGTTRVSEIKFK